MHNRVVSPAFGLTVAFLFPFIGQAQEKSVKPGVNKPFENPDPRAFIERFEREGREVFDERRAIVAACKIQSGESIADIGAGTGLFTRMFAEAVGSGGQVYAVDIAQSFVEHIVRTSREQGRHNVKGVVCKPDSVELPKESVDIAFICDTYHHFEFPEKTLRSIHQSLRPGGRLILIDFDRIAGVSPGWILDHVRADKQTFAKEIVAAGFELADEVNLMKDSYFLRFEKIETATAAKRATVQFESDRWRGKRVIEWGWDEPDTKYMRENLERMEQLPFDGLVFHVTSAQGGNFVWEMWGDRLFHREEFNQAVNDLQATPFRLLSDRFLRVNVTPGSVDWFDDSAWSTVLNNFRVAAQVAREGNAKGFMFDVEQYNSPLFDYRRQKWHGDRSFAEYQDQVRRRGQQWIQGVNRVFPDITILLTFGYSIAQPKGNEQDRSQSLYGLLADFLDGVLDACSDRTTIVDAWESSYPYKRAEQFTRAYDTIRNQSANWSANPTRYRHQVRAGFGIWMDYDWRNAGWDVENFSRNHFTPAELETAVRAAIESSDNYVWIYTEQPRWWTRERLPEAYIEAIRGAKKRSSESAP
jgi:ubiquinone/menaquinone biosynthesis C-methylase UbiE